MPITSEEYREALRHFASGVTIVTIRAAEKRHGLTVSAFASVSPEPPLVAVMIAIPLGIISAVKQDTWIDYAVRTFSIAGIAIADGRFDTLVAAVVAAGLADDLAGGEWTVFAPTDDAFAKLELTPDNVASAFSQEELADILLYHVLVGSNSTAELKGMLGNVVMANGKQAGLKFYEDHVYVNDDSQVIVENVIADNGTIHAVDTVILPPWPRE